MLLEELNRGHGTGLAVNRPILVLNPVLYKPTGTGSFFYDLYLKSTNAAVTGSWQLWNPGTTSYDTISGTTVAAESSIWKANVEVTAASIGKLNVLYASSAGTPAALDWSYALTRGGGTITHPQGGNTTSAGHAMGLPISLTSAVTSTGAYTREFFLSADRDYTFTANMDNASGSKYFTWKYYDGADWVAYSNGTDASFVATPPSSGRVQIVTTTSGSDTSVWSLTAHPR